MKCGNSILTEGCLRMRYFLPRTKRHLFLRQPVPRKNANRSWSTNPPVRPEPIPILTFQPTDSAEEPYFFCMANLLVPRSISNSENLPTPRITCDRALVVERQVYKGRFSGRGKERPCGRPPAQIRASGTTAHGSYLGSLAKKRSAGCGCKILEWGIQRSTYRLKRLHVIR